MAARHFFFRMEGGHLMNANRLVQTPIDIDQRVYNAIHGSSRGVRRHQIKNIHNYAQKEEYCETQTFLTDTTTCCEQRGIFQPWANRGFILTSSMHVTEHNDTLNKRVG